MPRAGSAAQAAAPAAPAAAAAAGANNRYPGGGASPSARWLPTRRVGGTARLGAHPVANFPVLPSRKARSPSPGVWRNLDSQSASSRAGTLCSRGPAGASVRGGHRARVALWNGEMRVERNGSGPCRVTAAGSLRTARHRYSRGSDAELRRPSCAVARCAALGAGGSPASALPRRRCPPSRRARQPHTPGRLGTSLAAINGGELASGGAAPAVPTEQQRQKNSGRERTRTKQREQSSSGSRCGVAWRGALARAEPRRAAQKENENKRG
ncbi:uncharacterized protein LOC126267804 [Schistocerca gregaria]|uniref:uncharacterized protein LOC126267804 n=1 Tax=Schistocerca gregaria TaxID=7010 RepID=UPI00211E2332|nr:uncharacterized protein LOC126267804 [Schistocerca gregaria]